MRDKELYEKILGIESPWAITDVELDLEHGEVRVAVAMRQDRLACSECGALVETYDCRPRRHEYVTVVSDQDAAGVLHGLFTETRTRSYMPA